jgi:putative ABC transport system permease protein
MWGWNRWNAVMQDIRYALRALRKNPGFAAAAIPTLALGIGASTAVFTVVGSVILKPLAYPESGRLVVAWERNADRW